MEKRETFASKRSKKRKANRKRIIQAISLILVLVVVLLFDINSPKADTTENLSYKVYLNGHFLGRISDPEIINNYLEEKTKQYYDEFQIDEIFTPEDFKIIPEVLRDSYEIDNERVLSKFKNEANFTVDAYEVSVTRTQLVTSDNATEGDVFDEEKVVSNFNVLSKDDFNQGLEDYIKLFVNEEEYDRIMNDKPLPDLEEDTMLLYNFYLDGEITIQKKRMNIDGLLKNSDEVVNYLLFKSPVIESKEEYVVKAGDTVDSVSISNEIMIDELILLNDSITTPTTILAEGQVINVTQTNPVLTVVREHYLVTREVIPHNTVVEYDPARWSYKTSWTKVDGVNGERKVKYKFTTVNGELQQGASVIESNETSKPITKVIVKGSKTSSRIGTGYFRWPTTSTYVTVGYRYYAPFGVRTFHAAVDIAGRLNDPIYAIDNGVVSYVGWNKYGGYKIEIDHNNGYKSVYAHLNGWPLVAKGAVVNKGAYIGKMGKSGTVTGIHLHLELWYNGKKINPYPYIKGWR